MTEPRTRERRRPEVEWVPKTLLGKSVAEGKITSIDQILAGGRRIKEYQIVDRLLELRTELIFIGGSPGKGGGIRRTPTKRTARMHRSGRRYRASAFVVVGNGDGYIGVGKGVSKENRDAIQKAEENAKTNIMRVKRGSGSWESPSAEEHSIPYEVWGKTGSVRVVLKPAPKGIGLCVNDEAKKIMRLCGIRDLWSKSFGHTKTRMNYVLAVIDALRKLNMMKTPGGEPYDFVTGFDEEGAEESDSKKLVRPEADEEAADEESEAEEAGESGNEEAEVEEEPVDEAADEESEAEEANEEGAEESEKESSDKKSGVKKSKKSKKKSSKEKTFPSGNLGKEEDENDKEL